jgi:hypothetical protein
MHKLNVRPELRSKTSCLPLLRPLYQCPLCRAVDLHQQIMLQYLTQTYRQFYLNLVPGLHHKDHHRGMPRLRQCQYPCKIQNSLRYSTVLGIRGQICKQTPSHRMQLPAIFPHPYCKIKTSNLETAGRPILAPTNDKELKNLLCHL